MFYPLSSNTLQPLLTPRQMRKRQEHSRYDAAPIAAAIADKKLGDIFLAVKIVGTFGTTTERFGLDVRRSVFFKHPYCMMCGCHLELLVIERYVSVAQPESWNLQFYGVHGGNLVLFTIDHKHPRALGGEDHKLNYQTMCQPCNTKKATMVYDPFVAARLRDAGRL